MFLVALAGTVLTMFPFRERALALVLRTVVGIFWLRLALYYIAEATRDWFYFWSTLLLALFFFFSLIWVVQGRNE